MINRINATQAEIVAALEARPLLQSYVEGKRAMLGSVSKAGLEAATAAVVELEAQFAAEAAIRAIRAQVEKAGFSRSKFDREVFVIKDAAGKWLKYTAAQVAAELAQK